MTVTPEIVTFELPVFVSVVFNDWYRPRSHSEIKFVGFALLKESRGHARSC